MGKPSYRTKIVKAMTEQGNYQKQFDMAIGILASMQEQYDVLNQKYVEAGMPYFEDTQTGKKKSPIVTTLESLRKDILQYQAALGLTPAGAKKLEAQSSLPGSSFGSMIASLEDDSS